MMPSSNTRSWREMWYGDYLAISLADLSVPPQPVEDKAHRRRPRCRADRLSHIHVVRDTAANE